MLQNRILRNIINAQIAERALFNYGLKDGLALEIQCLKMS